MYSERKLKPIYSTVVELPNLSSFKQNFKVPHSANFCSFNIITSVNTPT